MSLYHDKKSTYGRGSNYMLLFSQERILNNLSLEMETTSNRLDFVQKRVAMVMKKAGIKGQIMLILFLVVLFIILFVLVFLT